MASRLMIACVAVLIALPAAAASSSGLRNQAHAGGDVHRLVVQNPQVDQQMVICNAYVSVKKLDIMLVRTRQTVTGSSPLAYKQCKEFSLPLQEGDQIDFKAGGVDVGTFYATGMPKYAASLLLIPRRRSPQAVGMKFESHAFADLQTPQIAVVNACSGKNEKLDEAVKISEMLVAHGEEAVQEDLKFNSVVAVNPGKYGISLAGAVAGTMSLYAAGTGKYVVVKVGVEGDAKNPQELVVFPSAAHAAMRLSVTLFAVLACLLGLTSSI